MTLTPSEITGLTGLETETADPRFASIDTMPVSELARTMNNADAAVPGAVQQALPQISPAIEATAERMKAGGRMIYVGAGTPGRIGVLDASECPPTFGTPPEQIFAVIAGGPKAVVAPCEGAEDDVDAGALAMDTAGIGPLDTVIGIASSGRTPFVVAALTRARTRGALTVALTCNTGTPLAAVVEYPIEVIVGPEVVAGSTRLKAGTAQKLVLNMFSTIVMVQLGKTYGNLMVDVKPTNVKLRERALRMVQELTGVARADALDALAANNNSVKQTITALRLGLDPVAAAAQLTKHGGLLRASLGEHT